MLILLTDGRANVALRNDERSIRGKSQIPNPKSQTNPKSKIQNPKSKDVHHSALSTQRPVIWEELQLICAALRGESVVSLVIDTQHRFTSGGQTQAIAELLDGRHIYLPRPDVNAVYTAVATLANDP
jgi:Mg-chelatase subunit ChlD